MQSTTTFCANNRHRQKYKTNIPIQFLLLVIVVVSSLTGRLGLAYPLSNVLGTRAQATTDNTESLKFPLKISTTTAFNQKQEIEKIKIDYTTVYQNDSSMEYGTEKKVTPGIAGTQTNIYTITYWGNEIIDRSLTPTDITKPIDEFVLKGTKVVWRLLEGTEYGRLKYWRKMRVWATKYDAHCEGCTGRTYSGTEVKQGVCATDPKVVSLGTNFYVPGYGLCRAEDIGGAIKGNKIDLGYVNALKGDWKTGWTDIYLLTGAPDREN